MNVYLKMLMPVLFSILMWGCNGSSDSDSASNTIISPSLSPTDNSKKILGYDGVYKNEQGESLFYSSQEEYIYIYRPPVTFMDGYLSDSNRSILVKNNISDGVVNENSFIKTQLGDHYEYLGSSANLKFNTDSITVYIDINRYSEPSIYNKLPLADIEFDLMYQSYLDWDGNQIHFTPDDKLSTTYQRCTVTADMEKMPYYYRLTSGSIECSDSSPVEGENFHGVIYKSGDMAVLIMKSDNWVYRTTFSL
ncbi:hypothetical protein ACPF42_000832 [Vibrio cholerae]